ncbi:MAG: response regulator [Campylobacterales bacterium]|nr:response regulator [Campylobacterales bacterium]
MHNHNFDLFSNYNLLYIEDDVELARQTVDVLEDFVSKIFHATNSKDALNIIKTNKIDVIITDILLENENGIDFIRHLREKENIIIPTIVTTAYTDSQYLLDAIKLKISNYLVKPISIKELLETLREILLPIIQEKVIQKNHNMLLTISAIGDTKQVEIIRFIIDNLDENNILNYSYGDIMDKISVSKPTVIKVFKQLAEKNILVKIQNRKYQFFESPITEERS